MKTVIIVGAGATRAEARPILRRDLAPPLDLTFFEQVRLARYPEATPVQSYMVRRYGIDPLARRPVASLEEVLGYIFSDTTVATPSTGSVKAMRALLTLYHRSIADTTNPLTGGSRRGVCALVRKLISGPQRPELSFVTFNHDLLIEKALATLRTRGAYSWLPFSLLTTYGVHFQDFTSEDSVDCFSLQAGPSIPILKLHGSLNWVHFPWGSRTDPEDRLYCIATVDLVSDLWRGPDMRLVPVVVPPVYEKSQYYQEVLGPLRERAETELQHAHRVVIFGYSLPDADVMARSMIRRALHHNNVLKDLVVIDTSSDMASKVARLTGVKALRFATDVPSIQF